MTQKKTKTEADTIREKAQNAFLIGRLSEAIKALLQLVNDQNTPAKPEDFVLLVRILLMMRRPGVALQIIGNAKTKLPEKNASVNIMEAKSFLMAGNLKKAQALYQELLKTDKKNPDLHAGLAMTARRLGEEKEAEKHAKKVLEIREEKAKKQSPLTKITKKTALPKWNPDKPEHNILAFALWGKEDSHTAGAIENAKLAKTLFPEWQVRFYVDRTVPISTTSALLKEGADVITMPDRETLFDGYFWRLSLLHDQNADRFIIHDCHVPLGLESRKAVDSWLKSEKHFLVPRTAMQTNLVPPWFWGGVAGILKEKLSNWDSYCRDFAATSHPYRRYLNDVIWPLAQQSTSIPEISLPQSRKPKQTGHRYQVLPSGKQKTVPERERFIFPITAGRTGTSYLTKLFQQNLTQAETHHERTVFQNIGLTEADASHFIHYNTRGLTRHVRNFWQTKFADILYGDHPAYIEVSHFLAKAGLVDMAPLLTRRGKRIDFINLKRDTKKLVLSMVNRFDMVNSGFTWMFHLDPRWPKRLIDPKPFLKHDHIGMCLWYAVEMEARQTYYRILYEKMPNMHFHDVNLADITSTEGAARLLQSLELPVSGKNIKLPEKENKTTNWVIPKRAEAKIDVLTKNLKIDYEAVVRARLKQGFRFGIL